MPPSRDQPCPCGSGLEYKRCCGKISYESRPFTPPIPSKDQKDFIARIHGDVVVVVPDSLNLITSYVVREQSDWFEDEIKFVRELMRPGMRVIDIGASYGLYALTMASMVGSGGYVWACEPTSSTASYLKRSIELNGFNNITVIQSALSNRLGIGKLRLDQDSELNILCHNNDGGLKTEDVPLTTLDRFVDQHECEQIEFVKLDAEGEESNIVRGGETFFVRESPLVMYELNRGQKGNSTLIQEFEELGYRSYKLIPGLKLLAVFDSTEIPDSFQLNLFCCKNDCAQKLERRGVLVNSSTTLPFPHESIDLLWSDFFESKLFAKSILINWKRRIAEQPLPRWEDLKKALELYAFAHDRRHSATSRYSALKTSYSQLEGVCKEFPNLGRLCTFIRISWELGRRDQAIDMLYRAISMCTKQQPVTFDEPFLPVSHRFDDLDPENRSNDWMVASLLEQTELLRSFSSYYTGERSLPLLEALLRTGFASLEMQRRRQLIQTRYGMQLRQTNSFVEPRL